jgi:hypothetical protein
LQKYWHFTAQVRLLLKKRVREVAKLF